MKILTSKLLSAEFLTHAFTCRLDGVSAKPYESNNIAFHVGDNKNNIIANHQTLASILHYDYNKLVHMKQIHSNKVVKVDDTHNFFHPIECDAIITDRINIPLMVMVADCTPILLYDTKHHAVAAIHAGRAGAFSNIIKNSVDAMHEHFKSEGRDIIALLGPSICQECYEINADIYNEAKTLGYDNAILQKEKRYYLHVNKILNRQLLECGLLKKHIDIMHHCSSCEHDLFFSYRADGGKTGRQAGIIMLQP